MKKRMEEIGEKLTSAKLRERSVRTSSTDIPSHGGGRSTEELAIKIADLEKKYQDAWYEYNSLYVDCYLWIYRNIDKPIGGPKERMILVGRYVNLYPWDKVAQIVGCSEDAVKMYAFRYRKKLRTIFDDFPL